MWHLKDIFPEVIQSVACPDYLVLAYMNDGLIRLVDAKPLIEQGGVFDMLKDEVFFKERLTVLNGTVAWDVSGRYDPTTCIDLDPFFVANMPIVREEDYLTFS